MIQTAAIVIHGGAGTILRSAMNPEQEQQYLQSLQDILRQAATVLENGGSAVDGVAEAVRLLEDQPLFNAGKGSVYTRAGTHELDAAIMDGATLGAGAVTYVNDLKNPILAARAVMEHSEHVLLAGAGATAFAVAHGVERVAPEYFHTEQRYTQWQRVRHEQGMALLDHDVATRIVQEQAPLDPDKKFGTVGAVALDLHGNLAAATSTGGITNKLAGRIGDSPIIGAGCYADNHTAAMSATGTGESFIRSVALYDIAARMQYTGATLEQAAHYVVHERLPRFAGRGGLIAIDAAGNITMPFNTEGMYRGFMRIGEAPVAQIYR